LNDVSKKCLNVTLFDENKKIFTHSNKFFSNFKPGFGSVSGSAFVKKARSGYAYNVCGSETLLSAHGRI
jgi:hypothetical protein